MKLYNLLILMSMAISPSICASNGAINVEVTDKADQIEVLVYNQGSRELHVNRRLAVGLIERGADIEFIIRSELTGKQVQITATVEPWPLEDADRVMLRPDEIIGVTIRKCFIAQLYSLSSGNYLIKVRYAPDISWEPFSKASKAESIEVRFSFDADSINPASCFGS